MWTSFGNEVPWFGIYFRKQLSSRKYPPKFGISKPSISQQPQINIKAARNQHQSMWSLTMVSVVLMMQKLKHISFCHSFLPEVLRRLPGPRKRTKSTAKMTTSKWWKNFLEDFLNLKVAKSWKKWWYVFCWSFSWKDLIELDSETFTQWKSVLLNKCVGYESGLTWRLPDWIIMDSHVNGG